VSDNANGTYTVTIANRTDENLTISATIDINAGIDTSNVSFYTVGDATAADSTLNASLGSINADGVTISTITLQAKDAGGNNLVSGGLTVIMDSTGSAVLSGVSDNANGTYTVTMTNTTAENVTISATMGIADILRAEINNTAGMYHLFNSYKKYIIIQLYINAGGYSEESTDIPEYNTPKSYLTTTEGFYDFTIDNFYLTTEGYSIISDSQVDLLTGNIVKKVSPSVYESSPINMTLFRKDRQLNFKYKTPNFSVIANVIPRLKRVTF